MIVTLPRQFRAEELFLTVLRQFGNPLEVPDQVIFDFSNLSFVRPSGIVFLSNFSRFLLSRQCRVTLRGMNPHRASIRYLDDSGFFQQHLGRSLRVGCEPRPTTQPLHLLRHDLSHGWIGNQLLPWLSMQSGVAIKELGEFKTCMSEVFNNILDHAGINGGSVFAQWYPHEERLEIAIADFGVGIPTTVRRIEPQHSDSSAIVRAFDEGFSAKSKPQNRGAGLPYLLQNVLDNLGGRLTVRSQLGAASFTKSGNSLKVVPYDDYGFCPGTMIEIEVKTGQIRYDFDSNEDFSW